jgi:hypothetical protein
MMRLQCVYVIARGLYGNEAMTLVLDKINRPSLLRWAIGFLLRTYFSTSKASPNDSKIVIIVIIISEAIWVSHSDGIIAQRYYFGGVFLPRENSQSMPAAMAKVTSMSIRKKTKLKFLCYTNPPLS